MGRMKASGSGGLSIEGHRSMRSMRYLDGWRL
jgi:hypothetical protein